MIASPVNLSARIVDPVAALSSENGDPFAALFAALAPDEDVVPVFGGRDAPSDEVRVDVGVAPSPEALLALVAQMPLPPPEPAETGALQTKLPAASPESPAQLLPEYIAPINRPLADSAIIPPVLAPSPAGLHGAAERLVAPPLVAAKPGLPPAEFMLPAHAPTDDTGPVDSAIRPTELLPSVRLPETTPVLPSHRETAPSRDRGPILRATDNGQAPDAPLPPAFQNIAQPAPPPPAGPVPVMAQHMAGQFAAALPRLSRSGGEAMLTLDPVRLGRVTLSWQTGERGAPVLTVRAVEPVTATLLGRMSDDITAMLRVDPALADTGLTDLRIDIGRAERAPDPRHSETANPSVARDLASDAGQARQQHRAPPDHFPAPDGRAQVSRRGAVNPDAPAEAAAMQPGRVDARARLA